jgi:hypothetical protein
VRNAPIAVALLVVHRVVLAVTAGGDLVQHQALLAGEGVKARALVSSNERRPRSAQSSMAPILISLQRREGGVHGCTDTCQLA